MTLSDSVIAKTRTAAEIAAALAANGVVRVIALVAMGKTRQHLAAALHDPATRTDAEREIADAIDAVLASHCFAHIGAAAGAPAIVRLTSAPAFSAVVDSKELKALAKDRRVLSIEYDRPMTK